MYGVKAALDLSPVIVRHMLSLYNIFELLIDPWIKLDECKHLEFAGLETIEFMHIMCIYLNVLLEKNIIQVTK